MLYETNLTDLFSHFVIRLYPTNTLYFWITDE